VLVVNQRQRELSILIKLALESLTTEEVITMVSTQARGIFFDGVPMRFYGSTLLGYCAAFGLRAPIALLFSNEGVRRSLNLSDPRLACSRTGFLPLHAAVANGRPDMFDYLIGRIVPLDDECRHAMRLGQAESMTDDEWSQRYICLEDSAAEYHHRTTLTANAELSLLTPLQLSAKLGDQRMARHILRDRLILNWKWGPITSYRMELTEIDSAGEHGNDLMEIVASLSANSRTQELLLDSFMQGFMHELFLSKWKRFAGRIYYYLRAIDVLYMLTILYQGFDLKNDTATGNDAEAQKWLTYLSLSLALVLTAIELASIVLKWRNDTHIRSKREKLKQMFAWLWNFKAEMRIASYIASFLGCLIYLFREVDEDGRHSDINQDLLCFFYAFACYGHFRALMESFFVQPAFPTMGVQLITIQKMFANDVSTFLVFLFVYMFNYFTSMYITFPSEAAANHTDVNIFETLAPFEDWLEAASAVYNMAIFGVRFAPDLDRRTLETFSWSQSLNFAVFFFHHSMFSIMCLTLLVRLLMAMMTNTFQGVKKAAQLEFRLLIARAVLRHELLYFFAPHESKFAGTRGLDNKFYHSFLHVKQDPDGHVHIPLLLAQEKSGSLLDREDDLTTSKDFKSKDFCDFKNFAIPFAVTKADAGTPGSVSPPTTPGRKLSGGHTRVDPFDGIATQERDGKKEAEQSAEQKELAALAANSAIAHEMIPRNPLGVIIGDMPGQLSHAQTLQEAKEQSPYPGKPHTWGLLATLTRSATLLQMTIREQAAAASSAAATGASPSRSGSITRLPQMPIAEAPPAPQDEGPEDS